MPLTGMVVAGVEGVEGVVVAVVAVGESFTFITQLLTSANEVLK